MNSYVLSILIVVSLTTILIKFSPFIIFKKNVPSFIKYLGDVLPYAMMAMLVVYCLKGIDIFSSNHGLPEIIASLFVVFIHKFKHNLLLSIISGTAIYMILLNLLI